MFVGVGAARVRELFREAKKNAPAIVFIDEIDAVGRSRGAGFGGGNDEREQTLNQLLSEMDGFERNDLVVVVAATNRPDVLDPALLRPGRFDRRVVVDRPELSARKAILERAHEGQTAGIRRRLATAWRASTPGFSGADLANLVNEAALRATRSGADSIEPSKISRPPTTRSCSAIRASRSSIRANGNGSQCTRRDTPWWRTRATEAQPLASGLASFPAAWRWASPIRRRGPIATS